MIDRTTTALARLTLVVVATATLAMTGCASFGGATDPTDATDPSAELDALARRGEAARALGAGADAQLQALVDAADAWIREFGADLSAEDLAASLLLRPVMAHEAAMGDDLPPADREYGRLEHMAGQLRTTRRLLEAEHRTLSADFARFIARYDLETVDHTETSEFDIGDSFLPAPGSRPSRAGRCESMIRAKFSSRIFICGLVKETCERPLGQLRWTGSCVYHCIDDSAIPHPPLKP